MVKSIGLDYFIQPILALDRITLHNTYFSETSMRVLGFGRDSNDEFKIIVEQPFIQGLRMSDEEIETFMVNFVCIYHLGLRISDGKPEKIIIDSVMQILLWSLFLVIMWNCGGLTRGKPLQRRGTSA